jgi:hypothetical protein
MEFVVIYWVSSVSGAIAKGSVAFPSRQQAEAAAAALTRASDRTRMWSVIVECGHETNGSADSPPWIDELHAIAGPATRRSKRRRAS